MPNKIRPDLVKIKFARLANSALSVSIETPPLRKFHKVSGETYIIPSLIIRSASLDDLDNYHRLFSDPEVMKTYGTGKPITDKSLTETRLRSYADRWEAGNPFSGLAVYEKDSQRFVGHAIVGNSNEGRFVSEVVYLFNKEYWGKGIGTLVVSSLINCYIPRVMMQGYELQKIVATARVANIPSQHILRAIGFMTDKDKINIKYGAQRYTYQAWAKQLKNQYHHYYDKKDRDIAKPTFNAKDLTMATSAFGQSSNTAKILQKEERISKAKSR